MAESSAKVREIFEKIRTLSLNEQQLFREWLDAWIKLTEVEAKIKALGDKSD